MTSATWPQEAGIAPDDAQELAREAADAILAEPTLATFTALAVLPRGGELSQPVADALAAALAAGGRTVAPREGAETAVRAAGVPWAAPEEIGGREQMQILDATASQALVLVGAQRIAQPSGGSSILADVTVANPVTLLGGWSVHLQLDTAEQSRTADAASSTALWQRYPGLFIGAVAALVAVWLLSALRRRSA